MTELDNDLSHNYEYEPEIIGRKAWTAYIKPIVIYGFLLFFLALKNIASDGSSDWLPPLMAITATLLIYRLAVIRSFKLLISSDQISYSQGIFPWTKSGNWIRWRDADTAAYYNNFLSWITNSYTITIENKYTDKGKFEPTQIWSGRSVAGRINQELLRHTK